MLNYIIDGKDEYYPQNQTPFNASSIMQECESAQLFPYHL